jgi:flagellar hook-basal body complex protein FliE
MDSIKLNTNISGIVKEGISRSSLNKNSDSSSFGQVLKDKINHVDTVSKAADKMITGLVSGSNMDIHGTMIAMEKADVPFQLMMQIRNKLVAAYQEIYRMQV